MKANHTLKALISLSQTSENEVQILLSKDIKKRDFKNIVKLNTAHITYPLNK
ncbi:hypothetical protein [Staphylococcus aureus]|uniref:hypothetical protein n=1 Tax=Staphylococcus aureus TaxID=1280 RepID=UPI0035CD32E2